MRHQGIGVPVPDEMSEELGPDWEPVGDGTYRYVGKPAPWRWADQPLTAPSAEATRTTLRTLTRAARANLTPDCR